VKARTFVGWALRVFAVVALAALIAPAFATAAQAHPSPEHAQAAPADVPVDGSGPIGPADVDLLVKVRLAGLWEMPAGQMAASKGTFPRIREVGAMISSQHNRLDELVRIAAAELDVELPSQPNADQLGWLAEMERARGPEFDHVFVDRLRAAHGKVFGVIAAVRAGTRNDVVRKLAQESNDFVLNHLTLLESTGIVDWDRLPLPPEPEPARASSSSFVKSGVDPILVWIVLGAALIAGASTTLRVIRPR